MVAFLVRLSSLVEFSFSQRTALSALFNSFGPLTA